MSVSREMVLNAYRLLLLREAESDSVIEHHMNASDTASLVKNMISSKEFRNRFPEVFNGDARNLVRFPLAYPKMEIDINISDSKITELANFIKSTWTFLGEEKPHFSVLTSTTFLPENIDQNIEAFWETGHADFKDVLKSLARHGLNDIGKLTCNEFGCGVGRVTSALATGFAHVNAYDISKNHLEIAKRHTDGLGLNNIRYIERFTDFIDPLEPCDVFFSMIVLQHNPPPLIKLLIKRALESLNPNGIALFQVPVYMEGYEFKIDKYLNSKHEQDMEMHCLPQAEIFSLAYSLNCAVLEVLEDGLTGSSMTSCTFVIKKKK